MPAGNGNNKPLRVFVVDDSALMRKTLSQMLMEDSGLEIAGQARNGREAVEKITAEVDVVTLDIEMPEMDGLATMRDLKRRGLPCRVIMVSAHSAAGAEVTLRALRDGAEDFIMKPDSTKGGNDLGAFRRELVRKIHSLRCRRFIRPADGSPPAVAAPSAPTFVRKLDENRVEIVLIGASTGGPAALRRVISALSEDFPVPIAVAQHMPPVFTGLLANDLANSGSLAVVEAQDGLRLAPGMVVMAPGGKNLELMKRGDTFRCRLTEIADPSGPSPSVNALFASMTSAARNVLAVVLTGIGSDGADSLAALRSAGAITLAQNEMSSVVYGMPRAALEKGGVDEVLDITAMADTISRYTCSTRERNA